MDFYIPRFEDQQETLIQQSPNQDTIVVMSDIRAICNQTNRSSMDFSVKYAGVYQVQCPAGVTFNLLFDRTRRQDQPNSSNLKNGSLTNSLLIDPSDPYYYYIANPKGATSSFCVTFTGPISPGYMI